MLVAGDGNDRLEYSANVIRHIKEDLRHFWSYKRRGWAAKHFKRWYFWATHSRLKPIIDAAKTLKRHEAGLLCYFAHPIPNAGAEGLN